MLHLAVAPILLSMLQSADLSKKQAFLRDKEERRDVHAVKPPPPAASPVLTLHNVWTNESLPVVLPTATAPAPAKKAAVPARPPAAPHPLEDEPRFDQLTRDHFTNQATKMDPRLFATVVQAAEKFHARYVEIVSGFRAPKYQLMLRKKGHEVARESQHPRGTAVDFRIAGVPTRVLLRYIRSLHLGGVGYYPESKFVHADVGPVRFWRGH